MLNLFFAIQQYQIAFDNWRKDYWDYAYYLREEQRRLEKAKQTIEPKVRILQEELQKALDNRDLESITKLTSQINGLNNKLNNLQKEVDERQSLYNENAPYERYGVRRILEAQQAIQSILTPQEFDAMVSQCESIESCSGEVLYKIKEKFTLHYLVRKYAPYGFESHNNYDKLSYVEEDGRVVSAYWERESSHTTYDVDGNRGDERYRDYLLVKPESISCFYQSHPYYDGNERKWCDDEIEEWKDEWVDHLWKNMPDCFKRVVAKSLVDGYETSANHHLKEAKALEIQIRECVAKAKECDKKAKAIRMWVESGGSTQESADESEG